MRHLVTVILCALPAAAAAEIPVIERATADWQGGTKWRISVTLSHPDEGWDHYADGWELRGPAGELLDVRELLHPHVEEQPFTRTLLTTIPEAIGYVTIRGRCNVDGLDPGEGYVLSLPH